MVGMWDILLSIIGGIFAVVFGITALWLLVANIWFYLGNSFDNRKEVYDGVCSIRKEDNNVCGIRFLRYSFRYCVNIVVSRVS